MRNKPSIPLILVMLALPAASAYAAQGVVMTAGPVEGVAPFEADLRVLATGVDDETRLECELLFGDVTNGEPTEIRFVLEAPWPAEAVIPYTYRYAGVFTPDVTCVGGGTLGDNATVTVVAQDGNDPPQLALGVAPTSGPAAVTRTLTVSGITDPDGDTLDCWLDFDVHPDFNFTGGETVVPFTVAPPYDDVALPFNWDVARGYNPEVFCVDGRGGSVGATVPVTIATVAGNSAPAVRLDRMFSYSSEPGISRRFRVRASDPDGDPLRCQFRPTWNRPREWFDVASPYPDQNFFRTFGTFGSHLQAYALCVDPDGAMTSMNRGFEVDVFPAGNGFPQILDTAATPDGGELPPGLDVEVEVNAFDPDGDALDCRIDYGRGQGGATLPIPAARQGTPVGAGHTYDSRGSFGVSVTCTDGGLDADPDYTWVHVHEQGKRFPTVSVDADPDNGGGLLPVTLTLDVVEPDGQTLDCSFRYGTRYAGGGVLPDDLAFQLEPPYEPIVLETIYRGTHRAELSCMDPTGRGHDAEAWIRINAFNQLPTVESFTPPRTSSINDTLFALFPISVTDPNLDAVIDCELDFGDGVVWPFIRFLYPDYQLVNVSHLYPARDTPYEAVLSCDDNEGGTIEARQTIEVGAAANRPPEVDLRLDPPAGHAPFATTLFVTVDDVNRDEGDVVGCVVDFGDGSAQVAVGSATDFYLRHVYELATVFRPTVTCTDTFGSSVTVQRLAVGTLPGAVRTIPPAELQLD